MTDQCILEEYLESKLWIVTGKGGVGKTSVAAGLGKMAALAGKKVLLVETHACTHLGQMLGQKKFGYKEKKLSKNLHIIQINPKDAFEEFVLDQVKFKAIYHTVFNNKYVKNFMEATPGLNELLTIGKIWSLCEEHKKFSKNQYDLVILDAPATGHALALLKVSKIVESAVRVGPLKKKANKISQLIYNPQKTKVFIVTLAEDMPINETIELSAELKAEEISLGCIIINQRWPEYFSDAHEKKLRSKENVFLKHYFNRKDLNNEYIQYLCKKMPQIKKFELPLLWDLHDNKDFPDLLSQSLSPLKTEQSL